MTVILHHIYLVIGQDLICKVAGNFSLPEPSFRQAKNVNYNTCKFRMDRITTIPIKHHINHSV